MRISTTLGLAAGFCAILPAQSARDLSAYLPARTPLVVDLVDAAAVVRRALGLLEPLPRGIPAQARVVLLGLPLITQANTGRSLEDLLAAIAPGQATFAMFPAQRPFPVLLTRIEDAAEVRRIYRRLGKQVPHRLDGDILTVSDTPAHLRQVLQFRRSGAPSLLASSDYRSGRAAMRPGQGVRLYLNLRAIRGLLGGALWGRLPDLARVLFGPVVKSLDLADRFDGRLDADRSGVRLSGRLNASIEGDAVARLTACGSVARPLPIQPPETLACVSLDRDFGEVLRNPQDWLDDDGRLGVAKFISTADLLLSGASLLDDLLPQLGLPINLLVTAHQPDADSEVPRIKLPSFVLVFGVDPKARTARSILQRALVTIAAVSNPNRLRDKKPPVAVRRGSRGGYRYQFVSFGDYQGVGDPPLEYGMTPTLMFAHGHGILASTTAAALRMARALEQKSTATAVGDYLRLRGPAIAAALRQNGDILAMNRVLGEGGSRRAAQSFVDALVAIAGLLDLEAKVRPVAGATAVEFELRRIR